jgi:hypothetical protein
VTDDAGPHPPYHWPDYNSTRWRAPKRPLVLLPENLTEVTGPIFGDDRVGEWDNNLTQQYGGEPLGQRIIVHGRVTDEDGKAIPDTLGASTIRATSGRALRSTHTSPAPAARSPTPKAAIGLSPSNPAPTPGRTTRTPGGRPTSTSPSSAAPSPSGS